MKNEFNKLFKNFMVFFAGDFGTRILTFLMVPFYTGILSTSQYGEIDLINSTVNLLIPLLTLNFADAVFRFVMDKSKKKSDVLGNGFSISLIGLFFYLVVLVVARGEISNSYSIFMYFITFMTIIYSLVTNYLKAIGKLKLISATGFANSVMFIVLNIIFLKFLNLGIPGYFMATILSLGISTLFLLVSQKMWRDIGFSFSKENIELMKEMLQYALPLIPTNLGWWIIMLSNRFIISDMLGTSSTGIYAVANKIPTILQAVLTIFLQAWQISATSIFEEKIDMLRMHIETMLKYYKSLIFISTSFLIITTQLIMSIIAKNEFYQGWICSPFLLLAISFSSITGLITVIYTSSKKNAAQFYTVLVGAIVNVVLNLVLIQYIGLVGSTIASCVSYGVIMYIRLYDTNRILKFEKDMKLINISFFVLSLQAILYIYIEDITLKYFLQIILFSYIVYKNKIIIIEVLGALKKKKRSEA